MADNAIPFHEAKDAILALCDHDQRIMFRAILAPHWEAFTPQVNQQWTKAAVRDKAARLMQYMAEFVSTALENREPIDDGPYRGALLRSRALAADQQRMLLRAIIDRFQEKHGKGKGNFDAVRDMATLGSLLISMEIEHRANLSGWLYTGERVDPIKRSRREIRERIGR